jgi:HAMP domain-containing protein
MKNSIESMKRGASGYAELFAAMPEVKKLLRADDREGLAKALVPSFKLMKNKYGAEVGTFQSSSLVTYLRLSNPDLKLQDDQSKREMVVRANHMKETQAGIEVSVRSAGIRAVAPVFDDEGPLGSFEWGMGFTRTLQRLKDNTGAELSMFIDEKTFAAPITSAGQAAQRDAARSAEADRVAEGYRTIETTNPELMKQIIPAELLPTVQQPTFRDVVAGDSEYGVVAIPIFDFGGRRVGVVVGARNLETDHRVAKTAQTTFLVATLAGLILLAGAVQLVFNGFLVRPLDELTEDLEKITHGDPLAKIEMAKRADEIGSLAKKLEKLREKVLAGQEIAKP